MDDSKMRELFIDELTEATGGTGSDPIEWIKEQLGNTTHACCEEGKCCDYRQ